MRFKNTLLPVASLLQSKGNLLDLAQPRIMGILNTTPDSFYEGSRAGDPASALAKAEQMISDGAHILDIGGYSTRPGAEAVTEAEETARLIPVIERIRRQFPSIWISADTFRSSVAKAAVNAGAHIVNDISGGRFDPGMIPTVASLQVPYIGMHLDGSAETMHQAPHQGTILPVVSDELQSLADRCTQAGIKDLILDPGFGFSKTVQQNYELLNAMSQLRAIGKPLLAGLSRKSMIWKTLGTHAAAALNGTTALHMVALQQGASILRVHDVKEAAETIKLFSLLP